jgi:uncharacterized membrane protein YuzA (DUF378 family)
MNKHYILELASYVLVIFGALNWGMVGIFDFDIVARLFGRGSFGARVIYVLIGIAAIIMLMR